MEVKKANSGWIAFLVSGIVAIGYGVLAISFTETFIELDRVPCERNRRHWLWCISHFFYGDIYRHS